MIRRLWNVVRFPPPYQGPILSGRLDGAAYLLGWTATFAHLALWIVVLALGLHRPWQTISTSASIIATLLLLTIVLVIHRRMGRRGKLHAQHRVAVVARSVGSGRATRVAPGSASAKRRRRSREVLMADDDFAVAAAG